MKNILILGALGHIGSKLIRSFADYGNEVKIILIDSMKTNKHNSLYNLPDNVEYKFIEGDIRNGIDNIYDGVVDCIIHLAALTNPTESAKNSKSFIEYNKACTESVLNYTISKSSELIFISSTSVYSTSGTNLKEDLDEKHLNGQTPYSICKLEEEKLF